MPNDETVFVVLRDLVAQRSRAPSDRIRPDTRLIDVGVDSVQAKDILVDLEQRYGITIPDREVVDLESLADIAAFVARKTGDDP